MVYLLYGGIAARLFFGYVAFFIWGYCWFVATFGGFCIAVLVCYYYSFRRMTLRVQVFLEIFYWLSLKFSKAPDPLRGVEGRWPWRWWPGCTFTAYIRCCPLS